MRFHLALKTLSYLMLFCPGVVPGIRADDSATKDRPNILIIFTDDQRADTIAALGNKNIKTPNIDRLVHRGLAFDRAYMQGACNAATCMPSRAMLLTGKSVFHIDEIRLPGKTWPEAFGDAGYTTCHVGKWHNGDASLPRAFQESHTIVGGMGNPMTTPVRDLINGKLVRRARAKGKDARHVCELIADDTITFLEGHKTNKPFLCYVAFDAPHDPHIVPPDFSVNYDPKKLVPPNFLERHPFDNGEMTIRDEKLLPMPRTREAVGKIVAEYYRYITYLDTQVGRVLDALDASPFAKNTIVVFSSDSGVARGSHGLNGKQNLYEYDSVRVPLIICGPGILENKRTQAMCYLFDLLPTLGARCQVPAPPKSEGVDFGTVLKNPDAEARTEMFFAYRGVQRAVATREWKLIWYPVARRMQLFNVKNDPYEIHDLADRPETANQQVELKALLKKKMAGMNDDGGEWSDPWKEWPGGRRPAPPLPLE